MAVAEQIDNLSINREQLVGPIAPSAAMAVPASTNVEVPSTMVTFTQNVEQIAQYMPEMHNTLRARGPSGISASNRQLDSIESAARKQLQNIQAFRVRLQAQEFVVPFADRWQPVFLGDAKTLDRKNLPAWVGGVAMDPRDYIVSIESAPTSALSAGLFSGESTYEPVSISVLDAPQIIQAHARGPDDAEGPGYWAEVRDRLQRTLSLSLHELAGVLGLSYGNVQALGRRRPQTKTTRPLLRLDGLARAYLAADPERGARWLCGEGSHLLYVHGIDAFQSAIDRKLFPQRSETAKLNSPGADDDRDLTYVSNEPPPATTGEAL